MATLARAIAIAAEAHQDQQDKAGAPYVLHPLRLMLRMHTEADMMAAVLRDVVEDTPWTLERLRQEGFPEEVLAAVEAVTHRAGETYEAYLARAADPIARKVKRADLEDNMDLRRLSALTDKDVERLRRYHKVWRALSGGDTAGDAATLA
ncbi:MAG: HD domain-containing protein [Armatimonadetes bacterium]|nr:HD domain-containing protein [Armatimonadota bacterium]